MSTVYPPYECKLSKDLQEIARKELNEEPETREEHIRALRKKVVANKALKCPRDSPFLLRFLRARKFDVDRAYQLLINYYTVRANHSTHLRNLTPAHSKHILDTGLACLLPATDRLGRRILYLRFGKWNPEEVAMIEFLRGNVMNMEQLIRDEPTQIKGIVTVANAIDVGLTHVKNMDSEYMRAMTYLTQEGFPVRMKGMHFVNEPTVFGYMFAIVKPFLKQKFLDRHHFHGSSLESLHAFIDPSSLPDELGGTLGTGDQLADAWRKELCEKEKYFERQKEFKIDLESNLFGGSKKACEVSAKSITGTFKKLDI